MMKISLRQPHFRPICLALLLTSATFPTYAASCGPNVLGPSRILPVGTSGGGETGLKTYPRSLALADHEVVLTFDDGPWSGTTPKILDALAAQCVKATFFLIGRNAAAAPALVKREIAEGHTVGHHTMTHPSLTLRGLPDSKAREDISRGMAADDIAGYGTAGAEPRVPFFRYPGFGDTPALNRWLETRNIDVFGADFWASDWVPMTPEAELQLVLARLDKAHKGVILFHDTKAQTAAMLPAFLQALKTRGYKVVQIVPGPGSIETRPAPTGWISETERTLQKMWPKAPPPVQNEVAPAAQEEALPETQ